MEQGIKKMNTKTKVIIISSLILSVVIIIGLAVIYKYNNQKKPKKIVTENYTHIYNLENQGKFKEARNEIKTLPDNPNYKKVLLANSYLDEGSQRLLKSKDNSQKAQKILLDLKASGYDTEQVIVLLGYSYELAGNFDKALVYYQEGLKKNPSSADANLHIGHLKWLEGKPAEAMPFYEKAEADTQASNSIKYRVYLGLGVIYDAYKHNINKTEEYFKKALPIAVSNNTRASVYYDLSTLEIDRKDNVETSLEYAKKALENDPTNDLGYVAYARAIIRKGTLKQKVSSEELKKAKDYLVRAMFMNPYRAITRYQDGQWEFLVGHNKMALSEYNEALKLIKADSSLDAKNKNLMKSDVYFTKAVVYLADNNFEKEKENIKQAFHYNPVKTTFMLERMNIDTTKLLGV